MLTIPIKLTGWIRMLFGISSPVSDISKEVNSAIDSEVIAPIHNIAAYVAKALSFLSDRDGISSCRLHREFGWERKPQCKNGENDAWIYLTYLWDSADKIIESSRHLSTNPKHQFSIDLKSEIKVLSGSMHRLSDWPSSGSPSPTLIELVEKERDFVKHIIEIRSNRMKHEDFNDGSLQYSYLTLLFHINSFLIAASRLISAEK